MADMFRKLSLSSKSPEEDDEKRSLRSYFSRSRPGSERSKPNPSQFSRSKSLFAVSRALQHSKQLRDRARDDTVLRDSMLEESDDEMSNQPVKIHVYAFTYDPTIAWDLLKQREPVKSVRVIRNDTPIKDTHVRVVCLSDTHSVHAQMQHNVPHGDILIVAGGFTSCGHPREVFEFDQWLSTLPHRYKLVIAGSKELTLDPASRRSNYMGFEKIFHSNNLRRSITAPPPIDCVTRSTIEEAMDADGIQNTRHLLTNCMYLEDSEIVLYGIRIYGTPWQPATENWAFNLPRGQACLEKWNKIPADVDILVSHTPPLGHGDLQRAGLRKGCVELLNSVRKRIRPKYHVFGHVHEGHGCTTDGHTKFINASICNIYMKPKNAPIVFDLPLPVGHQK